MLRVEQQDALAGVIEPLKQWFFGGHEVDSTSPMAQMMSMYANAVPTPAMSSSE